MEELVKDLMKQSPWAAVNLAVIIVFMRHLRRRDEDMERRFKEFHEEHIYARQQTTEAVQRNSSMLETNVSATNRNSHVIELQAVAIQGLTRSIENFNNGSHHNGHK